MGSQGDSAVGTIASSAFGAAFAATSAQPAELSYFLGLADQVVAEVPIIRNGALGPDVHAPGIGITIDEEKLSAYRSDR